MMAVYLGLRFSWPDADPYWLDEPNDRLMVLLLRALAGGLCTL